MPQRKPPSQVLNPAKPNGRRAVRGPSVRDLVREFRDLAAVQQLPAGGVLLPLLLVFKVTVGRFEPWLNCL
ncbi:hypothetical protein MA16_Dca002563 [Dendrobium catenatum]|uniref:Uncharacterized protein n=1 Tax=Dendrobium catenatum TaxID=906689 RepID=A0A2I0W0U7_9ASPA|nr:hypothetical protein MA16_Dca002563 [Dendrobium catenatum]